MNDANIVVGLGFGDEGKGITVARLCYLSKTHGCNPIVIRFNGGPQAGHTVQQLDSPPIETDTIETYSTRVKRHVFSSFGSGTLQSVPTYWSEYCPFSPGGFMIEAAAIRKLVTLPSYYIHENAPLITPFDMLLNRAESEFNNHGTCGIGISTTIARELAGYSLHAIDMLYPTIARIKLNGIVTRFKSLYSVIPRKAGTKLPEVHEIDIEHYITAFLSYWEKCLSYVQIKNNIPHYYNYLIFEGAQGVMLDQSHGFFPHVTRSNTTSKNALEIINRQPDRYDIYYHYVTRCYQTRHGNGPMTDEGEVYLKNNEFETNVLNEFQGKFRKGRLDLDLLRYAIMCDSSYSNYSNKLKSVLHITCIDQLPDGTCEVLLDGKTSSISCDNIPHLLNLKFNDVFLGYGPSVSSYKMLW